MPPGYHKEWHIGVRVVATKKLVAFISGVPMTLRARKQQVPSSCLSVSLLTLFSVINVTEINYLCVHKRLRSKRLAPVLIKEVTRQTHLKGVFQAIYTAGVVIPTPISTCRSAIFSRVILNLLIFCFRYFHRSLNVPKLVDIGFCYVPRNMTQARMVRLNAVPEKPSLAGLREMEDKDVVHVASLFTKFMKRYDMVPIFDLDEIRHQFLSGKGQVDTATPNRREGQVTWAYVIEVCLPSYMFLAPL